ncbi:hypothetical protein GYH30_021505 [Glycine max]|nr:hypothetical protein GYH30_021505 [Glycine max]
MTGSQSITTTTTTSLRGIIELLEGHPSRNVVEIISHTSWGPKPFPGRVKLIFKVHNVPRIVAMKSHATAGLVEGNNGEENARYIIDRNEGLEEWEVVVVVVVMVYDEWARVTHWVEDEFGDMSGSRNDDLAPEVVGELVVEEVVALVEGEVP